MMPVGRCRSSCDPPGGAEHPADCAPALELQVPVRAQPVARIASPERVAVGERATFDAGRSSTVEGSRLVSFDWTVSGTYVGSGATLEHKSG
jgi:hypothetical protein